MATSTVAQAQGMLTLDTEASYRSKPRSELPRHLYETLGQNRSLQEIMSTADYEAYLRHRESYDNLHTEYQDSTAQDYIEDFGLAYRNSEWISRDQSLKGELADMDLQLDDVVWDLGSGGNGAIEELASGLYDIEELASGINDIGEFKPAEKGFAFSNLRWLGVNALDRETDVIKLHQRAGYKTGIIEGLAFIGYSKWVCEAIEEGLVLPKVILLHNSLMYGAEEELSLNADQTPKYPGLAGLTEGKLRAMIDILAPQGKILIYETGGGTRRGARGEFHLRALGIGSLQVAMDTIDVPAPQIEFDTYDYYEAILQKLQEEGLDISFSVSHGPNADQTGSHFVITKN
jgi:hypothetical protein